jgi:hypothetical protein
VPPHEATPPAARCSCCRCACCGGTPLALLAACSSSGKEEELSDPGEAPPPTLPGAPGAPASPSGTPAPGAPAAPGGPAPAPAPTPANASAFAGAPAYVATLGPSTIDTSGKGNGHLSFNALGNPAGKACLNCHDGGGKGGAPGFLFAGTVFEDKAATKPAVRAEVRVVGADGKGLSAYTDVNGNFFFRVGAGAFTVPAIAGARNATAARTMINKFNDANCNECHGAAARITF